MESNSFIDESVYVVSLKIKSQKRIFNNTINNYDLINVDRLLKLQPCTKEHFQNPQTQDYFF